MKWPKVIKPGSTCDETVGIFDIVATAVEITGQTLPDSAAEDSLSFLPALKGEQLDGHKRKALINHSIDGLFAIRQGKWKLCRCAGSGGWAEPTEKTAHLASLPEIQLYDLENDPGERNNLAMERGDIVDNMTKLLHRCVMSGNTINGKKGNPLEEELEKWEQLNWLPEIPEQFVIDD
jgi:arylsulfatase A-like enzyme